GAPPGYVGFDQGGLLTEAVTKNPHCVVLLDEIEKAHPEVFNLLLQVMDHGTLTDNNGRKADFRNVVLIMTSNAGAEQMSRRSIGFTLQDHSTDGMEVVNKMFTPEFRNRLDSIIQFAPLPQEVVLTVVDKFIVELQAQLDDKSVQIEVDDDARQWLLEKGYDKLMGARPLARVIQENLKKPLAELVLFGELSSKGGIVHVSCDDDKLRMVRKYPGGQAESVGGPDDTTAALVDTLNKYQADLFITSGHATERNWQIGFSYRNGYFRSRDGKLWGEDTRGEKISVDSQNPKVYLPIGNCLMGHIDSKDAMALAWMKSAGVHQMIGYTVPTWFGYGGWGCLDYFVEQPGRYTFAEAFHANHHALNYAIESKVGNERGLKFDRDVVALYGDPAWDAKMAKQTCAYDQVLTKDGETYTLEISGNRGEKSFQPVNENGSQRGWRPMIAFLPNRIQPQTAKIVSGEELHPLVADDFVLVPNPRTYEPSRSYRVSFTAKGK
ncbi:MAG: AAA family ATPase, partial [Planctomycetota bacterium]